MTNLSSQAQAVLDAYETSYTESGLVAALKAAADQVAPEEPYPGESQFWDDEAKQEWQNNQHFRKQLLAIATELEALQ